MIGIGIYTLINWMLCSLAACLGFTYIWTKSDWRELLKGLDEGLQKPEKTEFDNIGKVEDKEGRVELS